MPVSRYLEEIGLAAMLAVKRLAGIYVTPSTNNAAHSGFETQRNSLEVQNRDISGPTKRTYIL